MIVRFCLVALTHDASEDIPLSSKTQTHRISYCGEEAESLERWLAKTQCSQMSSHCPVCDSTAVRLATWGRGNAPAHRGTFQKPITRLVWDRQTWVSGINACMVMA